MKEKLQIKAIYDDFLQNVNLTEEQIKILNMYINKETRYKISSVIGASERTIGNEIIKLKKIYNDYCELQISKATILKK